MDGSPRSVAEFDAAAADARYAELSVRHGFLERLGGYADLVSPWFHPIGSPIDHEIIWEAITESDRNQLYQEFVTDGISGAFRADSQEGDRHASEEPQPTTPN